MKDKERCTNLPYRKIPSNKNKSDKGITNAIRILHNNDCSKTHPKMNV